MSAMISAPSIPARTSKALKTQRADLGRCVENALMNLQHAIVESHAQFDVGELPLTRGDQAGLTTVMRT